MLMDIGRHRSRSIRSAVTPFPGTASGPPDDPELPEFVPLNPNEVVDVQQVSTVAATGQLTFIERKAKVGEYHVRRARQQYRATLATARARLKALSWRLIQVRERLEDVKRRKAGCQRFIGQAHADSGKEPATGWEYTKLGFLFVLLLVAVANGTLTVSSVMLNTPAFEGSYGKAISAGLGLFLMPSLGAYFPFFLLSRRPGLARVYLFFLVAAGMGCFFVFGITWSYTYAVQTGNELLLDLTTIGLGDIQTEDEQLWLFRNANWLSLLANILGDAAFAGCAKAGMTMLANSYTLFRRRALQPNPEWQLLDQEEQGLVNEIVRLEADRKQAEEREEEVKAEREDYVASVKTLAETRLFREVDLRECHRQQVETLEQDVTAAQKAVLEKRKKLEQFLLENPGTQKGANDED